MASFRAGGLLMWPAVILIQACMMMMVADRSAIAKNTNHGGSASSPNYYKTTTFCHSKADGLYSDPSSRDYFWVCWEGGLRGARLLCPPNTLWNHSSRKCAAAGSAAYAASSSRSATSSVSTYNSTHYTSSAISPSSVSSHTRSTDNGTIPVWSWDGLLHCLSEGCLVPVDGHDHHNIHRRHSTTSQLGLGIPCKDAQELLSIAQSFNHAWIPAPHGAGAAQLDQFPDNSYYTIPAGDLASRHWKIRFDSVDRDPSDPSLTWIKASLVDYSPSQTILSSWQGGPSTDSTPAQFVLKGPLFTSSSSSLNTTCYYSVALEKPDSHILQPFAKALINDSNNHQLNVGPYTPSMPPSAPTTNLLKPRGPHKPQRTDSTSVNGGLNTQQLTPQNCLTRLPWADIMAAALCYAYNFVGTSTLGPCSTFASTDISLIANCFQSFITNLD